MACRNGVTITRVPFVVGEELGKRPWRYDTREFSWGKRFSVEWLKVFKYRVDAARL